MDTSVISALFDDRNQARKHVTEGFFAIIDQFNTYTSSITISEIHDTPDEIKKRKMRNACNKFTILNLSPDVEALTRDYIAQGIFLDKYRNDAYHVAFAVIHEMDYLVSWNFKHLVKERTRKLVNVINAQNKYSSIFIVTPAEVS